MSLVGYQMEVEFTEVDPRVFRIITGITGPHTCPNADHPLSMGDCVLCGLVRGPGRRVRWS